MKFLILMMVTISLNAFSKEFNCKIVASTNQEFVEGTKQNRVYHYNGIVKMYVPDEWSSFGSTRAEMIDAPTFTVSAFHEAPFIYFPNISMNIKSVNAGVSVTFDEEGQNSSEVVFNVPGTKITGKLSYDCTLSEYRMNSTLVPIEVPTAPEKGGINCHTELVSNSGSSSEKIETFNGPIVVNQDFEAEMTDNSIAKSYMYLRGNRAELYVKSMNTKSAGYIVQKLSGLTSSNIVFYRKGDDYMRIRSKCLADI